MVFEWDSAKDAANVAKHGLSFEDAIRVFEGDVVSAPDHRHDYGEPRINSIGRIDGVFVIVVTHTDRSGRTRIISPRPAKRQERQRYAEALRKKTQS